MNYQEFFQIFFIKDKGGALKGCTSKIGIVRFFFESITLKEDQKFLPVDDTYGRWFSGKNIGEGRWTKINDDGDFDKLTKALIETLNTDSGVLGKIMAAFGVSLAAGEQVDIEKLARAISRQFCAISQGMGTAENIVPEEYQKEAEPIGHRQYLSRAGAKYRKMKILGEEEVPLQDCYVCNDIGLTPSVFSRKGIVIQDVSLDSLRRVDDRLDARLAILVGSGGIGKTMMLRYLFTDAVDKSNRSGKLPVLVELRNFSYYERNIENCIISTVQEFESSFTESEVEDLLQRGRLQLLFDGLDELDPDDINVFQKKLEELIEKYPVVQIIIASRECDAIKGINGFVNLHLYPFNNEKCEQLIDKLLIKIGHPKEAKKTILDFLMTGTVKKDGVFATNPMLLTFIVTHYERLSTFTRLELYEEAYDAMVSGHDKEKTAYDRIFHSVADTDEFKTAFREFCGESFLNGDHSFTKRSFEKYVNNLQCKSELENPRKLTKDNFLHDTCSTACIMYEKDSEVLYIDPGFQEYLFAEFYYHADTEKTKAMGKTLQRKRPDIFYSLDAFQMLYQIDRDKVEVCLFLPFLQDVFRGKDDNEDFFRYLKYGYGKLRYSVLDETKIADAIDELKADKRTAQRNVNVPANTIAFLVFDAAGVSTDLVIESNDEQIAYDDLRALPMYAELVNGGDGMSEISVKAASKESLSDDNLASQNGVKEANGETAVFGGVFELSLAKVEENRERFQAFWDYVTDIKNGVYDSFLKVKDYYNELKDRQEENQFS